MYSNRNNIYIYIYIYIYLFIIEKLLETCIAHTSEKNFNYSKSIKINAIYDLWNVIKYRKML